MSESPETTRAMYATGNRRLRRRRVDDCTVDEAIAHHRECIDRMIAAHREEVKAAYLRGVADGAMVPPLAALATVGALRRHRN